MRPDTAAAALLLLALAGLGGGQAGGAGEGAEPPAERSAWYFFVPSASRPGQHYVVYTDAQYRKRHCACPAWRYCRAPKSCKHAVPATEARRLAERLPVEPRRSAGALE